jgi:hypothetical protein
MENSDMRSRGESLSDWKPEGIRMEVYQDTLYLYSNGVEPLKRFGESQGMVDCNIRPVNLEDLFLKVTGRD